MEQVSLNKISADIEALKSAVEEIQNYLIEDDLEVSNEVIREVEEARKSKGVSHEEVIKEFCK